MQIDKVLASKIYEIWTLNKKMTYPDTLSNNWIKI